MLGDKKFMNSFMLNYPNIQRQTNKQMKSVQKDEAETKSNLDKTSEGISNLKKNQKSGFLSRFIFGGLAGGLAFTVAGGLLLMTLVRMGWRKWKKEYMPKTEETSYTIMGVQIPGLGTIKNFFIGIYNFITVGIPEAYHKVVGYFKGIYEELFGKKGCIRSVDMLLITVSKLFACWLIGVTKDKAGGWIRKMLIKVAKFIPGWGTAIEFIAEFAPELYSFIMTRLVLMFGKQAENNVAVAKTYEVKQKAKVNIMLKKLRRSLRRFSAKIQPFVPPESIPGLVTPHWTPGDVTKNRPRRAAIWKRPVRSQINRNVGNLYLQRSKHQKQSITAIQRFSEDTYADSYTKLNTTKEINPDSFYGTVLDVFRTIQGCWIDSNNTYRASESDNQRAVA